MNKQKRYQHNFLRNILYGLMLLFLIFQTLFISSSYSAGFKLKKIDSHFEPEIKSKDDPAIILPNTNIEAGLYRYDPDDEGLTTGKIGFLINKEKFYFLQSRRPGGEKWQYGLAGDVTYGIYKNYLLIEASAGGTTRNSYLFLFKYGKDKIQFLDATSHMFIKRELFDFISVTDKLDDNGYPPWEQGGPIWMNIKDIDSDGRPEIKLLISVAHKFETYFKLFLEIRNDHLKVDFNPHLYKPFFEQEKQKSKKIKNDQYYIYGFLAKELSLSEIKSVQKHNKRLINILENIRELDKSFIKNINEEKFILKQYNLKRR